MNLELPPILQKYVEASNQHDVRSILACFSEDAVVRDEGEAMRGKEAIEAWIAKTIAKYKFQFKPVSVREDDAEIVVAIEISGTFPGSPVAPNYHFTIEKDRILALAIG